jgi:hypothetical protein
VKIGGRDSGQAGDAARALMALTAEPSRRESAIAGLSGLPSRRIADIAAGLRHASMDVRRASVEALGRMKRADASRALEQALDDRASAVRLTGRRRAEAPWARGRRKRSCWCWQERIPTATYGTRRPEPWRGPAEPIPRPPKNAETWTMPYRADSLGLSGHVTTLLMELIHERLGLHYAAHRIRCPRRSAGAAGRGLVDWRRSWTITTS